MGPGIFIKGKYFLIKMSLEQNGLKGEKKRAPRGTIAQGRGFLSRMLSRRGCSKGLLTILGEVGVCGKGTHAYRSPVPRVHTSLQIETHRGLSGIPRWGVGGMISILTICKSQVMFISRWFSIPLTIMFNSEHCNESR